MSVDISVFFLLRLLPDCDREVGESTFLRFMDGNCMDVFEGLKWARSIPIRPSKDFPSIIVRRTLLASPAACIIVRSAVIHSSNSNAEAHEK